MTWLDQTVVWLIPEALVVQRLAFVSLHPESS